MDMEYGYAFENVDFEEKKVKIKISKVAFSRFFRFVSKTTCCFGRKKSRDCTSIIGLKAFLPRLI